MNWTYSPSTWERTMKIQECFQRANQHSITWKEAAQMMGVSERTIRRWKTTVEESSPKALSGPLP